MIRLSSLRPQRFNSRGEHNNIFFFFHLLPPPLVVASVLYDLPEVFTIRFDSRSAAQNIERTKLVGTIQLF